MSILNKFSDAEKKKIFNRILEDIQFTEELKKYNNSELADLLIEEVYSKMRLGDRLLIVEEVIDRLQNNQ
jgi:hypothetical protein